MTPLSAAALFIVAVSPVVAAQDAAEPHQRDEPAPAGAPGLRKTAAQFRDERRPDRRPGEIPGPRQRIYRCSLPPLKPFSRCRKPLRRDRHARAGNRADEARFAPAGTSASKAPTHCLARQLPRRRPVPMATQRVPHTRVFSTAVCIRGSISSSTATRDSWNTTSWSRPRPTPAAIRLAFEGTTSDGRCRWRPGWSGRRWMRSGCASLCCIRTSPACACPGPWSLAIGLCGSGRLSGGGL